MKALSLSLWGQQVFFQALFVAPLPLSHFFSHVFQDEPSLCKGPLKWSDCAAGGPCSLKPHVQLNICGRIWKLHLRWHFSF